LIKTGKISKKTNIAILPSGEMIYPLFLIRYSTDLTSRRTILASTSSANYMINPLLSLFLKMRKLISAIKLTK
jgi:hypothetical protein